MIKQIPHTFNSPIIPISPNDPNDSIRSLNLRHEPAAPLCRFDWLHLGIVHSHMHSALGLHNRSLLYRVLSSLTPIAHRSSSKNKVCRPLSQTLNQGLADMFQEYSIKEKAKPWFRVWLKEAATYSPTGKPQYHRR